MSVNSLSTTDRLKKLLPQLFNEQQSLGNYYLRLQLTNEINILLNLSYIQESLIIDSSQITPIPNLPEYVIGLMSSRNEVFLALDLAHLAGFSPETLNQREYQTIVVRLDSKNKIYSNEFDLYGLAVKQIQGISRILPEHLIASTTASPRILSPFIQSSIQEETESQPTYLIDLNRLVTERIQS